MELDLVLIHPPALWPHEVRRLGLTLLSEVVPSTPAYDMYPIGFLSLASYLSRHGYRVAILNLAALSMLYPSLDPSRLLRRFRSKVYAIDLHWMVHAKGVIEVAKLVKRVDPGAPVVVGGLSATIYHRELFRVCPYIDYVVLGDTTEEPMRMLLEYLIDGRGSPYSIPNIAWREKDGVRSTGIRFIPSSLDDYAVDYREVARVFARAPEPLASIPFASFYWAPVSGVLPYKGCPYNCVTCGGSRYTYTRYLNRGRTASKSPRVVAEEVWEVSQRLKAPVFILNDLTVLGRRWVRELVAELRARSLDCTLFYEFFRPPPRDVLALLVKTSGAGVVFQLSPETHDERIRMMFGRRYGNRELMGFISNAIATGCMRVDLYFMIGLPGQDIRSVAETLAFIRKLYSTVNGRDRIEVFISPLAPFVDPGSLAFDNPRAYGYRILARSLTDHVNLLLRAKEWYDMLNYETEYMSRKAIAYAAAKALLELKRLRRRVGDGREWGDRQRYSVTSIGELYPTRSLVRSLRPRSLPLALLMAVSAMKLALASRGAW